MLLWRRRWALALVSFLVCASVLLVNLSYPEWTGGWSTGPRLLVPLIPFAMIPVAGLLAERGRWRRALTLVAATLALIGGVEMLLFQGAGARIPNEVLDDDAMRKVALAEPLRDAVWPLWTGKPLPPRRGTSTDSHRISPRWRHRIGSMGCPPDGGSSRCCPWSWRSAWRSRS